MGDAAHETVMPHGGSFTTADTGEGEEVAALGVDGLPTLAALTANGLTRKDYQVKESTFHADNVVGYTK